MQTSSLSELDDGGHVGDVTEQVDRHKSPGFGRDGSLHLLNRGDKAVGIDIAQHSSRTEEFNNVGARDPREAGNHHLIAGSYTKSGEREVESGGTVGASDGVRRRGELGKRGLKSSDLWSLSDPAALQRAKNSLGFAFAKGRDRDWDGVREVGHENSQDGQSVQETLAQIEAPQQMDLG
jgi:hypothetical protein